MTEKGRTEGPDERIRISEIQQEKKTREQLEKKKEASLLLLVLSFFKNILKIFEKDARRPLALAKIPLQKMKDLLVLLQREDRSEDPKFLEDLASSWGELLEMALQLKDVSEGVELESLIRKIHDFLPRSGSRSLGYYLAEYAGKTWLPFPYMEMIRNLHEEHQRKAMKSVLSEWIHEIDRLIAQFAG